MKTLTNNCGDFFYRVLAAVAIGAPMLLALAVSRLPEATDRGEFMVYGLGTVLAVLIAALVLRAAHNLGFSKAIGILNSAPNRSVTA
jgi:hypothetical protein